MQTPSGPGESPARLTWLGTSRTAPRTPLRPRLSLHVSEASLVHRIILLFLNCFHCTDSLKLIFLTCVLLGLQVVFRVSLPELMVLSQQLNPCSLHNRCLDIEPRGQKSPHGFAKRDLTSTEASPLSPV